MTTDEEHARVSGSSRTSLRRPPRRTVTALAFCAALAATLPATTGHAATAPPKPPSDARLAAQPTRPAVSREQFYLLLPDRFANGDHANDEGGLTGDRMTTGYDPTDKNFYQGGDLKGLTDKLDYIKGLGTTAIWLAPVFKNKTVQVRDGKATASYHGYAVTDFTHVDPHFGTDADLTRLIGKAHAKGMKVYFDVITNHTADTVDYAEKKYGYRSKGAYPYLDTEGRPFDDSVGMATVDTDSLPYTPHNTGEMVPSWLNDPTMYHNRGDSTFAGESALYGDFYGLDDLWTERPEVVSGMERIYEKWVEDFDVDGFRVDTAKNVNMEFWTQWATALDAYAHRHGRDDFFLFAEAFSADPAITAPYVTRGRLDSTLDFPFQSAARNYASRGGPASDLADVFAQDYRYTTDKTNAYSQVTFLGSHDMGRIGYALQSDNPKASDTELLQRDKLAHELMFFSRGSPVIYSGDEQGFTGSGDDVDSRQTMFASKVADYLDDDEIGTDRTHADDSYDTAHPLYKAIAALSKLRKQNPALADGVQKELYAKDSVYAFSRTGDDREYVVAVNNATEARTVELPVESARFSTLYGGSGSLRAAGGTIAVTVPALSSLVLRADGRLPAPASAPTLSLQAPDAGATGTVTVAADPGNTTGARVVFAAQVGNGRWRTLGTADHAPYQVTQVLPSSVTGGTALRYKAVVVDRAGHTASALARSTAGASHAPQKPKAERHRAVVHYRRADGDYTGLTLRTSDGTSAEFSGRDAYGAFAWLTPADGTGEIRFTVERDGVAEGPERALDFAATSEVWTQEGTAAVEATRPADAYPPQDTTKAVIHYHRADGDYDGWGLHTWTGSAHPPEWNDPIEPVRRDAFGLVFEVPLKDGAGSLSYIIHKKEEKDVPADEALDFSLYGHEVWRVAGDAAYLTPSLGGAFPLDLDPGAAAATWLDENTVVWHGTGAGVASQQLVYAADGGITLQDGALSDEGRWLRLIPTELTDAQKKAHPDLAGTTAFTIDPRDRDRIPEARRATQLLATQRADSGALLGATAVTETQQKGTAQ
ncbi:hypothetical protein J3486_24790 [Streptomyces sp. VRA16 Mangrove soil]|nr:hypothetical protein [Streptomyces sp. VRA16 Mangrove soil]